MATAPPHDANMPLLQQGGYAPYPQLAQGQYQQVPTDKQMGGAYQPTVMAGGAPTATYVAGPGQPSVMVGQPGVNVVVVGAPGAADPRIHSISDLLCLSVFTTLCCNLLFGIIAIVFSVRVRDAKRNNDYAGAKSAHNITLTMNILGIVLTVALIVVMIIMMVSGMMVLGAAIGSLSPAILQAMNQTSTP